jgi:hypothetical protein
VICGLKKMISGYRLCAATRSGPKLASVRSSACDCVNQPINRAPCACLNDPTPTGSDGASVFDSKGERVPARAVRRPGSATDLLRVLPSCKLPSCPRSNNPARPNVLMFGDDGVVMDVIDQQQATFQAWLATLPKTCRLAIVEVGAGKAIPTIRRISEAVLRSHPHATLVRINLDDSEVPEQLSERCVCVGGMGALDALRGIAAEIENVSE